MTAGLRSALTLVGLSLLLVTGTVWGWAQLTKPFPGKADPPPCVESQYAAGENIYPQDVTVSVLNASDRAGLAGRTMQALVDAGFDEGDAANAPAGTEVAFAEIWAADPEHPAVKLVRSRFGKIEVTGTSYDAPGVVVVVGDEFETLRDGRESVTAKEDAVVCGPAVE